MDESQRQVRAVKDVAAGQRQVGGSQAAAVTVKALTAAVSRGGLGTARKLSDLAPRWVSARHVEEV